MVVNVPSSRKLSEFNDALLKTCITTSAHLVEVLKPIVTVQLCNERSTCSMPVFFISIFEQFSVVVFCKLLKTQ